MKFIYIGHSPLTVVLESGAVAVDPGGEISATGAEAENLSNNPQFKKATTPKKSTDNKPVADDSPTED